MDYWPKKEPKDKANQLILLALSINPDIKKAKDIAKKIANTTTWVPIDVEEYISDVVFAIDNTEI